VLSKTRLPSRRSAALLLLVAGGVSLLLWGLLLGRAKAASTPASPTTGVVNVETRLGYEQGAAAGTGIVLASSGEVLTNNHVIRGATTIRVVDPGTGRSYAATVLGYSVSADVAVLRLSGASRLRTATIGDSSKVRVGAAVTAVGNAGGQGGTPTVVTGTVTGLHQSITVGDDRGGATRLTDLIRTNADLEPGDSGGPLLDSSRRVIGMDTAASAGFAFRGSGSGDGFAVPIGRAMTVVKQIESRRSSATVHIGPTSFIGISAGDPDDTTVAGALVGGVLTGSPAASVGLVAGDVITSIGGRSVASATALVNALLRTSPGQPLLVRWWDQTGHSRSGTIRPVAGPPQ